MSSNRLTGALAAIGVSEENQQSTDLTLPLDEILLRESDTRQLNQSHVEALAESISALGLIQPIAVDAFGRLLAGGHRLKAIELIQRENPKAFNKWFSNGVPVHRFEFDASKDERAALAIEVSENEKRVPYSPSEVRELADRLIEAGYRHLEGRPKKGEKALAPSLALIIGKSQRTVERYLANSHKKTPSSVGVFAETYKPALRSLSKMLNSEDVPDDVAKLAERLQKKLESYNRK